MVTLALNNPSREKKFVDGSSEFLFRSNERHKHLPEVKVEYGEDGDILVAAPQNPDTAEYFTCDINGCSFKAKTIKSLKGHKETHKGNHKVKKRTSSSSGRKFNTIKELLLFQM